MFYQFNVVDPKEIDLKQILDENPDQDVFLVTISNSALLMVRDRFLKNFQEKDKLFLGSEIIPLSPKWGWSGHAQYNPEGKCWHGDAALVNLGAKFWIVPASETPKLVVQVRAAREYLAKEITVKVTAL